MSRSREMRGRMDGFALLGNHDYSKAKQTHEVSCLEPVETDVETIGSLLHVRLCSAVCVRTARSALTASTRRHMPKVLT